MARSAGQVLVYSFLLGLLVACSPGPLALPAVDPTPTAAPRPTGTPAPSDTPALTLTPTPSPTVASSPTVTPTHGPSPTPSPTPTDTPTPVCDCSANNYDCPDFQTHAEAQACFAYCWTVVNEDIHHLDRDMDGQACETLP